jgi:hypothetical protein
MVFTYVVALSYLAAFSPLIMALAFITTPALAIFSGVSAYKLAQRSPPIAKKIVFVCFMAAATPYTFIRHLERVVVFSVPSNTMSPALIAGDHFALDQRPSEYRLGDIVAMELPNPQRLVIRRIKKILDGTATVGTENGEIPDSDTPLTELRGKALYVVYSWTPKTLTMHGDRFLLRLQ